MNVAILVLIAATSMRPSGDMRDVAMGDPVAASGATAPTVTIDTQPFTRTVTCTGSYTLTGTATDATSVAWAASPSGESGACTGTDSWTCVIAVSPDASGEGVETIAVAGAGPGGTGDDTETIGFYVVTGSRDCWLAQDIDGDGTYNSGYVDTDAVTTWVNSGASGLDITQSSPTVKPRYRTDIVGGQPTIQFDGGDRLIGATNTDWSNLSDGTTDVTLSIVYANTTSAANTELMATSNVSGFSSGTRLRHGTSDVGSYATSNTTSIGTASSAASVFATNVFSEMMGILDDDGGAGVDFTLYENNVSVATAARSGSFPTSPTNPLAVGGGYNGFYLNGHITRVLTYTVALSATQRAINNAVDNWALGGTMPVALVSQVIQDEWLFIGDSLTEDGRPVASYPSRLSTEYPSKAYVNLAVGGVGAGAILTQWRTRAPKFPEAVFVLGGTNNIVQGLSGADAYSSLAPIYSEAAAAGTYCVALTPPPFGTSNSWTQVKQDQMDILVADILADGNPDVFVDLNTLMADSLNADNMDPLYEGIGDGVHPDDTGIAFMATSVDAVANLGSL